MLCLSASLSMTLGIWRLSRNMVNGYPNVKKVLTVYMVLCIHVVATHYYPSMLLMS